MGAYPQYHSLTVCFALILLIVTPLQHNISKCFKKMWSETTTYWHTVVNTLGSRHNQKSVSVVSVPNFCIFPTPTHLSLQVPAPHVKKTPAQIRVFVCSSGRASPVTVAWRHMLGRYAMMVSLLWHLNAKHKSKSVITTDYSVNISYKFCYKFGYVESQTLTLSLNGL